MSLTITTVLSPPSLDDLDDWADLDHLAWSLDSAVWEACGIYALAGTEAAQSSAFMNGGMNVNDAVTLLQSRGFVVDVISLPGEEPAGQVTGQNPTSNVEKPYGSTITIYISEGPQDTGGGEGGGGGETDPGNGGEG